MRSKKRKAKFEDRNEERKGEKMKVGRSEVKLGLAKRKPEGRRIK